MKKLLLASLILSIIFLSQKTGAQISPPIPDPTYSILNNFWLAGQCFEVRLGYPSGSVDCSVHESYIEQHKQEFFNELRTKNGFQIESEITSNLPSSNMKYIGRVDADLFSNLFLSANQNFKNELEVELVGYLDRNAGGDLYGKYFSLYDRVSSDNLRDGLMKTLSRFTREGDSLYVFRIGSHGIIGRAPGSNKAFVIRYPKTSVTPKVENAFDQLIQKSIRSSVPPQIDNNEYLLISKLSFIY